MKTILSITFLFLNLFTYAQFTSTDENGKKYINYHEIDSALTCDSIKKLENKYGSLKQIPDENLKIIAVLAQLRCSVQMLNEIADATQDTLQHYQAQVVFTEENGNPRVLFNLIDLKTLTTAKEYSKAIVDFAPIILAGSTGPIGEVLLETGIATAVGKYSVEAYYESAIKNDPLIILYPGIIPGKKFTADAVKELKLNKVYNEVTKVWESPVVAVVTPFFNPIKTTTVILDGAKDVGKEVVKAAEKVVKKLKFWK